ncbi:MAG: dTMP kinase [Patescibacteria group bacterium]
MKKRGKLIVFDAIDGAGKTTQVQLLTKRFRRLRKPYHLTDFPQYDKSFFGAMCRRYLKGDFGETEKTNPYLISLLYALDRYEARAEIEQQLQAGRIVVSDRYAPANKIHQTLKISNKSEQAKFLRWLDEMEFKVLGVPKPDVVLFLDVPPSIAMPLMKARGKRDMHERDYHHQQQAYLMALQLYKKYPNWIRIQCMRSGQLLPPEVIHEQVWRAVKKFV